MQTVIDTLALQPQEGPQACPERSHCLPNVARRLRHQQEGTGHPSKGWQCWLYNTVDALT